MIAQFDSRCFLCPQTVKAGSDVYYNKGEGTAHWDCYEHQPPDPRAVALADELGYQAHADLLSLLHERRNRYV